MRRNETKSLNRGISLREEDEYFSLRLMQRMSEHRKSDMNKKRKSSKLELYSEACNKVNWTR